MSMKSDIYANYRAKHEAANEAIGGEPEYEHYLTPQRRAEIEALPRSRSWGCQTNGQGYLLPDGQVIELRRGVWPVYQAYAVIFQNEAHHNGYYEIMGMGQYFEG